MEKDRSNVVRSAARLSLVHETSPRPMLRTHTFQDTSWRRNYVYEWASLESVPYLHGRGVTKYRGNLLGSNASPQPQNSVRSLHRGCSEVPESSRAVEGQADMRKVYADSR
ncbi:uncharacterized protein LAJ45_10093 [Morchella importuna]|uniref:uncharacterized protein n=1 Tax=Morchella importuna TaxID=1174673 RepID=UPI001E8E539A|nr:uncharacterized protein LAJ45_10093 [Morchella importuna]KAH8145951.1 hypothetical protein LAJ45_10093 [Morchella importuna]